MRIILIYIDNLSFPRDNPLNHHHLYRQEKGQGMLFSELKVGQRARIVAVSGENSPYRQRLIALGLLPGTEFKVTRMAPLGDPVEIFVRGFALSLRKHEASILALEEVQVS